MHEHCSLAKACLYCEIRNRIWKSANPSRAMHLLLASFSFWVKDSACIWLEPMWVYSFDGELAALTTEIRCTAMSRPQHSRREYTWHSKPLSIPMGPQESYTAYPIDINHNSLWSPAKFSGFTKCQTEAFQRKPLSYSTVWDYFDLEKRYPSEVIWLKVQK